MFLYFRLFKVLMKKDKMRLKTDDSWSFSYLNKKETNYATHGYHRYPAKFIPQIVRRLINENSKAGDWVMDPYGGCGTTIVEARLSNRNSIGFDINPAAVLMAMAKVKEIDPAKLERANRNLLFNINRKKATNTEFKSEPDRLRYWFKPNQYLKLKKIYKAIQDEQNEDIKRFYKCCFSNILKTCSIWYSKSIKPMKDPLKKNSDPLNEFVKHLELMTRQNNIFFNLLLEKDKTKFHVDVADARKLNLKDNSLDLIITSPPYVTSYEYAELHQLSLLWLGFVRNLNEIKKDYVGTISRSPAERGFKSEIAEKIIKKLFNKDNHLSKNITNYYSDLNRSISEMHRTLKNGKKLCLIIGNTEYRGVKIDNLNVAIELMEYAGFKIERVIKRKISSKTFTPYRDKNGRFTNSSSGEKRKIYQYEYIIISKK